MNITFISIVGLFSLIFAGILSFRRAPQRDIIFWMAIIVPIVVIFVLVLIRQLDGWETGISTALWMTILSCLTIFIFIATTSDGWRLSPLLLPYLSVLGGLAVVSRQYVGEPMTYNTPTFWINSHIIFSIGTYGLITLAAISSLASSLQSRVLKLKTISIFSGLLPSVRDCENLQVRLLIYGELVLVGGLLTGVSSIYLATGELLVFDHKTVFSLFVLILVALLLFSHWRFGTRGKIVTQMVLLAYLFLTLGYPGVKIITYVINP